MGGAGLLGLWLLGGMTASGSVVSWTNTTGGAWSAPLNWDTHFVPRSFDTVVISAAGTYVVTLDVSQSIASLIVGGTGQQILTNAGQNLYISGTSTINPNGILLSSAGSLSGGPMTVQGAFNWLGGTANLPMTIASGGVLTIAGGVTVQSPLTNSGTINWTNGTISIFNNNVSYFGSINNQSGGLFNIQCDQTMSYSYGSESFQNAGIVRKTAATSYTTFSLGFTNSGTVDAQSGTIAFNGGGTVGGTYNTAAGSTIEFDAGQYTESGTVTVTGTGLCRLNGATITLNDRIAKFVLANGVVKLSPSFQGSGAIQNLQIDGAVLLGTNVVTGTLGFNGGGTGVASPLTIAGSGVLDFNGAAVNIQSPLTNFGTIEWSGAGISILNNTTTYSGAIYNQPGALFDIQCDQTLSYNFGFEWFQNAGTVRKSAGLGTTTFNVAFTNTAGIVDAESGTIRFGLGGNLAGTYTTAWGAIIEFGGGNFAQAGAVTVTGAGLCRQNGGQVIVTDRITNLLLISGNVLLAPNFQTNGTIQSLQLDGATLTGSNVVTGTLGINGGAIAQSSPLTVAANGTLNFNGAGVSSSSPVTNYGTVNWNGSGTITLNNNNNANNNSGAFYNQPGALFNAQNDLTMAYNYGFEFFNNRGTVRKSAGLGTTTFNVIFTNTGVVDAQSGTIRFAQGGTAGGTYNTATGAIIEFGGGSFVHTGPVNVTGSGVCRLNGASLTLTDRIAGLSLASGNVLLAPNFETNGTIQNLQIDGALLVGTNVVTGTLGMNGGGIPPGSPLTVASNATLNFNGAGVSISAPLTNFGNINWTGGGISLFNNRNTNNNSGAIYNQPGALFSAQNDQSVSYNYGYEYFQNLGTVRKSVAQGVTTFNVWFTNAGTVDAQSGTIQFGSSSLGGTIGGTYKTATGTTIQFTAGNYVQTPPVSMTGTGVCRQNGATVTLNDRIAGLILAGGNVVLTPNFQGTGAIQNLQLDGALLVGANTVTGTLGFNGGGPAPGSPLTVTASGTLNLGGAGVTIASPLTNFGTIAWTAGTVTIANNGAANTGVINNQPGGLFDARSDQSVSIYFGGEYMLNAGTVRKSAGLGTTTFNVGFTNAGTIDAQSGTLRFAGAYTPVNPTMNFGLTSLAFFGRIAFSSLAPLTGTLSANFNGTYFPSPGDSFQVLSYGSFSGAFTTMTLPSQAVWQTSYGPTIFSISVASLTGAGLTLAPIANRTINAGATLLVTNTVTDANPTNTVTFSLKSAPAGAVINTNTGVIQWRAPANRAGTSNPFTVSAVDNGTPPATDSKSFSVFVNPLNVTLTPVSYVTGRFTMQVNGSVGPDYTLQASTNLSAWSTLVSNTPSVLPFNVTDTNAGAFRRQFYRVLLGP